MYVDFQYFHVDDHIVVKELAIFDENFKFLHYIFLPPFPITLLSAKEKRKIKWLETYHHNLKWDFGFIDYKYLKDILKIELSTKFYEKVYVKGLKKKMFLELYDIKSINLEELGMNFKTRDISGQLSCRCHPSGMCSLRNVFFFKIFVDNHFKINK